MYVKEKTEPFFVVSNIGPAKFSGPTIFFQQNGLVSEKEISFPDKKYYKRAASKLRQYIMAPYYFNHEICYFQEIYTYLQGNIFEIFLHVSASLSSSFCFCVLILSLWDLIPLIIQSIIFLKKYC